MVDWIELAALAPPTALAPEVIPHTPPNHRLDLVECERIAKLMEKHSPRFLTRVMTADESERCSRYRDPTKLITGRWAAEEAILKMIGTGLLEQTAWTNMEILPSRLERPQVELRG